MGEKLALMQFPPSLGHPHPDLAQAVANPPPTVAALLREALESLGHQHPAARQHLLKAISLLEVIDVVPGTPSAPPPPSLQGRLAPWQIARVTRYIESSPTGLIRIQDLAALTHLSPSYFSRAFRATTGMSPYSYVIQHRVARAQAMILQENTTLSQVALDCGFADQAHLTRLFHRVTGVSPSAWRRANKPVSYEFGDSVPNPASSFNRVFHE